MAVHQYEDNGKIFWRYYVQRRSKMNPALRLQRRGAGFENFRAAQNEERKQLIDITRELTILEQQGCTWAEVVDRWESFQKLYPSKSYAESTIQDHAQLLRNWTSSWLCKNASELSRADAREVLLAAECAGKSATFCKKLKNTINVVFSWGLEERIIKGVHQSPVKGLNILAHTEAKMPEILSIDQVRTLLREAKDRRHSWYPVWAFTVLTGCRSGEAHGLRWGDVELVEEEIARRQIDLPTSQRHFGIIRLQRSWNARLNKYGPLKARYWRNVPVSGALYWLLKGLPKEGFGEDPFGKYLLPRFWEWDTGQQAEVLRTFCREIAIPSIRFHTLRACFATHLISKGVPSATVMKICGWKELKTMERYVRLAGIDERGATEGLDFIPTEQGIMENVVNMFDYRS